MKEDNKDFEYTDDNYTETVYKNKKWGNFLISQTNDFNKYIGDLRTAQCSNIRFDSKTKGIDPINGKTVDFYYFDENNDFWFMGFTDGTFIIREQTDHNMVYDTAHIHEPNMSWGNAYFLKPELCVTNDWSLAILNLSDNDKPKITPIGKWIEEHTDADIIGYYQEMVRQFEDAKQQHKDIEHERDVKEYNRLKEKLGL